MHNSTYIKATAHTIVALKVQMAAEFKDSNVTNPEEHADILILNNL